MSDWWPWNRRKARLEQGREKVIEAAMAARQEREAVLQLAEKRVEEGMPRREAYASVLNDFIERKRGSNG